MTATLFLCLTGLLGWAAGQDGIACSPQKTFPHQEDCSRYYYCDNTNTPQVFFCPPGVHFNPESEQCDLPESAPCPYVSATGQPSFVSLPDAAQTSDSSPPAEEGLVVGQSYASFIPNARQSFTPDLDQSSVSTLPDDGQPSVPSLPGDEVEQSYAPSLLPGLKQLYTPDLDQSSVSSILDLEQPSAPSLPGGEDVVDEQSYIPVFPGRGGPIFRQPEVEDRKDDVGDIIYDSKSDNNSSERFGSFFTSLQNFEKTMEESRQKEEGTSSPDFVDVKRQAPLDDVSVPPTFNFTDKPVIVYGEDEVKADIVQSDGTSEGMKTEGRCSADSEMFARKAPTDTVDLLPSSEKTVEAATSEGDKESKNESEGVESERKNTEVVWPMFPLTNLTAGDDDSDNSSSKTSDIPTVKFIELDTKNLTDEEKATFNYPTFTVLNLNESVTPEITETSRIETVDENKEAGEEKIPEKAEEIEEAKSTIIFESHSEEEENDKPVVPEDLSGLTKVVIKETAIL